MDKIKFRKYNNKYFYRWYVYINGIRHKSYAIYFSKSYEVVNFSIFSIIFYDTKHYKRGLVLYDYKNLREAKRRILEILYHPSVQMEVSNYFYQNSL